MKQIPVAPKYEATVNDKDYKFIMMLGPWEYYRGRAVKWYTDEKGRRHCVKMEDAIMERKLGHRLASGKKVEHRSERRLGIEARLDNSRKNLRIALPAKKENAEAKRIREEQTGGSKGVTYSRGWYVVYIIYYGKRIYCGHFRTLYLGLSAYGYAYRVLYHTDIWEATVGELCDIHKELVEEKIVKAGIDPAFLYLEV